VLFVRGVEFVLELFIFHGIMVVVICFWACMQVDSKHEAANAYAEAGHAYKKTSPKGMFGILSSHLFSQVQYAMGSNWL